MNKRRVAGKDASPIKGVVRTPTNMMDGMKAEMEKAK